MKRRYIVIFSVIALVLLVVFVFLTVTFDAVDISHKPLSVIDIDGKIRNYDVLVYSPVYKWAKTAGELCYTLAIAIIVYFAIEYSLNNFDKQQERRDRDVNLKNIEKLQEQINTNVFEGVLKKLIPTVLFETIANDVLNQRIITQNVNWEYTIEDKGTYYQLIQLINYDFFNIGNVRESIPVKIALYQNSINESWLELFRITKQDGAIIISETKEEIEKKAKRIGNNKFMREENIELEGKQTIKITHKIVNKYSSKFIQDFHFSNYSIVKLKIRVNKPLNCEFTAISTFSEKLEFERNDHDCIVYKDISGVLKGQALIYLVEPKAIADIPSEAELT